MISRVVKNALNNISARRTDREMGDGRAIMRMSSHRATLSQVGNVANLPVDDSEDTAAPIQDGAGNFFFLDGFSDAGGPDIV